MHARLLCLIFLSLCQILANAQADKNQISISLDSPGAKIDTASLNSIADISIQANTPDTSAIGYVSEPGSLATYTLVPQTHLSNWLQIYIDYTYHSFFSKTGRYLYCSITHFDLSEGLHKNDTYLHLQATVHTDSLHLTGFNWTLDTIIHFEHKMSDSYSLPYQNTVDILLSLVAKKIQLYGQVPVTGAEPQPPRIGESIYPPIVTDDLPREGAFITLEQLLVNIPAVTNILVLADKASSTGSVHVYHLNNDSTLLEIPSVFALCLHGELYVYKNNFLIPVERTGQSLLLSRYKDPDTRTNQAMYMRMILKSSPGNENPFGKEYSCTKAGYQNVVATCVDLTTGDLSF